MNILSDYEDAKNLTIKTRSRDYFILIDTISDYYMLANLIYRTFHDQKVCFLGVRRILNTESVNDRLIKITDRKVMERIQNPSLVSGEYSQRESSQILSDSKPQSHQGILKPSTFTLDKSKPISEFSTPNGTDRDGGADSELNPQSNLTKKRSLVIF